MSTSHPRRIHRKAAEQLLDGSAGPGAGPDQLTRVLAAAAAPGRESERAGEQMAVAAFQAHHLAPVATSRRGQMIKSPLAKLLTTKVLATALAAFTTGGVALAASTGAFTGSGPAADDSPLRGGTVNHLVAVPPRAYLVSAATRADRRQHRLPGRQEPPRARERQKKP